MFACSLSCLYSLDKYNKDVKVYLIDVPSIQFIFGPIIAMAIAARFSKFVIKMVDQTTLQLGLLGTLIGCVGMLQNIDDPQAVGPAYAVCFLTLLYSLVLKIFASQASEAMILPIPETKTRYKIFAGILLSVLMILPMASGAGLSAFADAISLFCMLAAAALISLVTYLIGGTDYLKALVKYLPLAGIVFFTVGLINILGNFDGVESFSPVALSITLLPIMYGNIVAVFIKAVQPNQCKGEDSGTYGYAALNFALIGLSFVVLVTDLASVT